jgi:hypothetical protein
MQDPTPTVITPEQGEFVIRCLLAGAPVYEEQIVAAEHAFLRERLAQIIATMDVAVA